MQKGYTIFEFNISSKSIRTVSQYKYVLIELNENLNFDTCSDYHNYQAELLQNKSKFKCSQTFYIKDLLNSIIPVLSYI